jgi:hypothetical protein
MKARIGRIILVIWLLHAGTLPLRGHEGPPYAILVDEMVGPCLMSVWADPDVGIGTFFIILEPRSGAVIPDDVKVSLAVQPVSRRLAEARHASARDPSVRRIQFTAEVPFDAQERWRLRILLESSQGGGEVTTDIEVTPPGFGPWDLLIYFIPFLLIGVLWLRAFFHKRAVSQSK